MPVTAELLTLLMSQHAAALELYARQWSGSPGDVVQEAFLKLAGQAHAPERPLAWLFTVVRNLAISECRSARRRQRHEAAAAMPLDWFDSEPGQQVDAVDAARALAKLPDDAREVVVAHLWGRLSFTEIGEVIGKSASTAHRRYLDGLSQLRVDLGACHVPRE